MNWISYPRQKPSKSGSYIASIKRPYHSGQLVFSYVTHYNVDTDKWHLYNPFIDKDNVGQEISDNVVGWVKDASTFLG